MENVQSLPLRLESLVPSFSDHHQFALMNGPEVYVLIPGTNLNIQGHLVEQVGKRAAHSPGSTRELNLVKRSV